ncbi:MAG TPA: polysaccharide biosynthesis tyrosine autokinase, partial [Gemmatimonadaceae bacterium]
DWTQLLRSFITTDPVVRRLALYLTPDNDADAHLFAGFTAADYFRVARYELLIDRDRKRWSLSFASAGVPIDSGAAPDSIGRALGFNWKLPPVAFTGTGEKKVRFTVRTPRETAVQLIDRLGQQRIPGSNFVRLTLEDPNATLAADILNSWVREFVTVAATLKKRKLSEYTATLEKQVQSARSDLDAAEDQLQQFKVLTITKPKETGAPLPSGIQETRDPAVRAYFDRSIEYDEIKRDVALLRSLIAGLAVDSVPSDALLQIRSVASNTPVTQSLRTAVTDYHTALANLATQRLTYQDEHPIIKTLLVQINTLKKEKIPQYASELLKLLRGRETEDSTRIAAMAVDLREIPQRTIEEEKLRRKRDAAALLFTNLQTRFSEAQLAEASSTPDINILDTAIAPLSPTKNTAPRLILMALIGGIGAAIGLAILLDMLDGRLRYPEQATEELGLPVAGTVPRFPKGGINQNSPEQTFQLVESFRSLRMTVLQAGGGRTVALAVSSPAPGEGKSLISANLAMSFADAGLRTVLVDGDTRRGALDEMFGVRNAPGLTDYLGGAASMEQVVRATSHPSLVIIPAGVRRRRSPELLTSPRLLELVNALRAKHDVVIFDTPPLAAGVDGYSIASATGSLLMVLRVGKTARRLAAEKLRMFERLPVDIVGAVLNGIELNGTYGYYGYVPGYEAEDEEETTDVVKVT